MKKISLSALTLFLLAVAMVISFAQCEKSDVNPNRQRNRIQANQQMNSENGINNQVNICSCLAEKFGMEELSSTEIEALTFMLEEEKLARDVYLKLGEKWDYRIFSNIARAESRHMEAMQCLIDRYDLEDPVGDIEVGFFVNEQLADLYVTLIEKGNESLNEALKVGATIEDLDLNDLNNWIEGGSIENSDMLAVFGELARGSRNHLRAFTRMLNQLEDSYTPQYIDADLYTEILEGEPERGGGICEGSINCANNQNGSNNGTGTPGNCQGNGNGQGQGNGLGNGNCAGGPCTGN